MQCSTGDPEALLKPNEGLLSCFLCRKKKGLFFFFFFNKLPPFAVLVLSSGFVCQFDMLAHYFSPALSATLQPYTPDKCSNVSCHCL